MFAIVYPIAVFDSFVNKEKSYEGLEEVNTIKLNT